MGSATARSRVEIVPHFLLAGDSRPESPATAAPKRLFERSTERLRIQLYLLFFLADISAIAAAFLIAAAIRLGSPFELQALKACEIIIPTFIAVAIHNKAYSIRALQRPAHGAAKVAQALGYAIAVAIALLFYMKASGDFSRQIFATGTALAMAFAVPGRILAGARIRRKYDGTFINRLVIADGVELPAHAGQLIVSASELGIGSEDNDPIALGRLAHAIEGCDSVIVACSSWHRAKWAQALKGAAVNVEIVTPELDQLPALGIGEFNGHRTLLVSARPLTVRDRTVKRALDLVVALTALLIAAPLMLLISMAILAESGGPVLFRQERVGQNNRLFELLKFRSFANAAADPSGERSVSRNDQRLTRVGKFIRRTSLDELPQLINVLGGHMSIVGPRPHALGSTAEDSLFWKIDSRYFHRHAVKPGMTGLAQVRGYRGATIRKNDLTNRLQSDLEYLCNWSIWRDLKIIVATFGVILHPNAF